MRVEKENGAWWLIFLLPVHQGTHWWYANLNKMEHTNTDFIWTLDDYLYGHMGQHHPGEAVAADMTTSWATMMMMMIKEDHKEKWVDGN